MPPPELLTWSSSKGLLSLEKARKMSMGYLTRWVRCVELDIRNDCSVLKRQHCFHYAGEGRCTFTVSEIWFDLIGVRE